MKNIMDNDHRTGKWCGSYGELRSDMQLTEEFVRMGVDKLSMTPPMILKVRKKIHEIKIGQSNLHVRILGKVGADIENIFIRAKENFLFLYIEI